MLDARLQLALQMMEACDLGADIGTDHALLPCMALKAGIVRHMLLIDISPNALEHARQTVRQFHLEQQTTLRCGKGLEALDEPCDCISVTGMGGITCANILLEHPEKLLGATLILGPQRDEDRVRAALIQLKYRIVQEKLCHAGGRYYTLIQAKPGDCCMNDEAIRFGSLIYENPDPMLRGYLEHCIQRLEGVLSSLHHAAVLSSDHIQQTKADLTFYKARYKELFT